LAHPDTAENRIDLNPVIALEEGLGYRVVDARMSWNFPGPDQTTSTSAAQRL